MRLKQITQANNLELVIKNKLPSHLANKILDFAKNNHNPTNPQERHTISKVREELRNNRRLVALIWPDDIDSTLDGLYVTGDRHQLIVSLPENSEIADLINQGIGSTAGHIIRGLVFGYDPEQVFKFAMKKRLQKPWVEYLKNLGIKLAEEQGGYASVASEDGWLSKMYDVPTGGVIVFPDDVQKVKENLNKLGRLLFITKYCPKCQSDILIAGNVPKELEAIKPEECGHDSLEGFYNFVFDITKIIPELEIIT